MTRGQSDWEYRGKGEGVLVDIPIPLPLTHTSTLIMEGRHRYLMVQEDGTKSYSTWSMAAVSAMRGVEANRYPLISFNSPGGCPPQRGRPWSQEMKHKVRNEEENMRWVGEIKDGIRLTNSDMNGS